MRKQLMVLLVGGLVTVSAFGLGTMTTGRAAEKATANQNAMMMQGNQMGNMDADAMKDMMNSPEMQKQCIEMMKNNTQMQQMMKDMLKTQPENQGK